ncbi:Oxidoreductase, aldo-keto reductase family [Streptococcus infantarius subsp. infantarius]|nr:Oxidoreductase, aldo-keto reductase family [Streptococcus infantarius subsp. infantarius]
MKYIEFAENERLSTIVLGMMRISQMSEDEVEALVDTALSIGINTFDLADIYGDGQCEVLLGKVLKRRPDLRNQMWIQSKCGIRKDSFTYFDFSKDYILDSIDGILERLQIERLDSLLLFTDPMPSWSLKKWRQLLTTWSKQERSVILGCPIKIL